MKQYQLSRRSPRTGYTEHPVYTGSLRTKPKGWKVVKEFQPNAVYHGLA